MKMKKILLAMSLAAVASVPAGRVSRGSHGGAGRRNHALHNRDPYGAKR